MMLTASQCSLLAAGRGRGLPWVRFVAQPSGGGGYRHVTVMGGEVTRFLAPSPGRRFLDLTLGGGGHSAPLLDAGASVVGMDRDPEALQAARVRLREHGDRFAAVEGNFAGLAEVASREGWAPFDGMVLDLGVSSPQLDRADRGFSFMKDGPLDMRMGRDVETTAADLVNTFSEEALTGLFRRLGEEPRARAAARAVVAERARGEIETTARLAECLEKALGRRGAQHPATRVFQALRMEVNGELEALEAVLPATVPLLAPGARLAVITFHSLEDRMVKRFFRSHSAEEIDRPEWSAPRPNPQCYFRDLTRRPLAPGGEELAANPRARSAKLRVVERRAEP